MADNKTPKRVVILEASEPIQDREATTSCPKYGFGQVEISSVCTACGDFKGIDRAINARTGEGVDNVAEWHYSHTVLCAFPLQRRIHPIQKIIRG